MHLGGKHVRDFHFIFLTLRENFKWLEIQYQSVHGKLKDADIEYNPTQRKVIY